MKKILLASLLLGGLTTASAEVVDGINYSLNSDGTAAVMQAEWDDPAYEGEVTIPETIEVNGTTYTVTSLLMSAFENSQATIVRLPNSVTTVGTYAFYNIKTLTEVHFGNAMQSIASNCFAGSTNVTDIYTESTVPFSITDKSFTAAVANNAVLHVPAASINDYATSAANPAWANFKAIIGLDQASDGTSYYQLNDDGTAMMLTQYKIKGHSNACEVGPTVNIPSTITAQGKEYTVTSLESECFYQCPNVTEVTFNEGLKTMGGESFFNTKIAGDVVFPDSFETMEYWAYYANPDLKTVTFGKGFKQIGGECFDECTGLTDITVLATTPPEFLTGGGYTEAEAGKAIAASVKGNITLHVPAGTVEDYKNSPVWGGFKEYVELPSPETGIDAIGSDANAPVRYFNLSGVEIARPEKGQLIIEVRGGKAVKTIAK